MVSRVEVNLAIRSLGPVDDNEGKFSFDCYFRSVPWHAGGEPPSRQTWVDRRLRFNTSGVEELTMDWKFLSKVSRILEFWLVSLYDTNSLSGSTGLMVELMAGRRRAPENNFCP